MNKPILNPKSVTNDVVTRGALPGSRKVYVEGVPFREVALSGGEAPIRLYDTSGPYTDDAQKIDIEKGLAPRRHEWIVAPRRCRDLSGPRAHTARRWAEARRASLGAAIRSWRAAMPLRGKPGKRVTQLRLCARRHRHRGNEIHRDARKSRPLGSCATAKASARRSRIK